MAAVPGPREVFLRVVNGVAERRYAELHELYAETTDVRHPMSPYGDNPLLSRDDVRKHFGAAGARVATVRFRPENIVVHETTDPEVIVAEFEYRGTGVESGEPFAAACVFVVRVRDGEIVESRDYIDHLAMAKARGELEPLIEALRPA
ncbi:MAG TPA: nuclear transport factor 2 family protein [Kribbellaceae bacterium]|nr:nuclear transport factor 2 family protein [Kribbellaceae bacterium]